MRTNSDMALFDIKNLQKTYFSEGVDTYALRDATFSIDKGEFVSIMGPSGSGKSTLLQLLGFLNNPTSGSFHFEGRSWDDYNEEELAHLRNARIGFVFQTFNLLPRNTVYENVRLPLLYSDRPEDEWDDRIRKVIQEVDLEDRTDYETYKLSGGEKQRVAIARALVNEPTVVFADEPTGNLDSESGQAVMAAIERLHYDLGTTIILITHETHTAEHANRMLKLRDGEIVSDEEIEVSRRASTDFEK
jgi:putative ABC transport system ATP-binding protein